MRTETVDALADRLERYGRVVEVGIGNRHAVARALATRGVAVTATDIVECETPPEVTFVFDDVTAPTPAVYEGAGALFGQNLPPELHEPTARLADRVGADCLFTTLGGDPPLVDVSRETLPGETLFVVESTRPTTPEE